MKIQLILALLSMCITTAGYSINALAETPECKTAAAKAARYQALKDLNFKTSCHVSTNTPQANEEYYVEVNCKDTGQRTYNVSTRELARGCKILNVEFLGGEA